MGNKIKFDHLGNTNREFIRKGTEYLTIKDAYAFAVLGWNEKINNYEIYTTMPDPREMIRHLENIIKAMQNGIKANTLEK